MNFMAGRYVIQYIPNIEFCIGVQGPPAENAPVVLAASNEPNTTWIMDPATHLITLADNPSFVLSLQGLVPAKGAQLCLLPQQKLPGKQLWDWLSDPPLILLHSYPNLCIDNRSGQQALRNPIQAYTIETYGPFQQWQFFQV